MWPRVLVSKVNPIRRINRSKQRLEVSIDSQGCLFLHLYETTLDIGLSLLRKLLHTLSLIFFFFLIKTKIDVFWGSWLCSIIPSLATCILPNPSLCLYPLVVRHQWHQSMDRLSLACWSATSNTVFISCRKTASVNALGYLITSTPYYSETKERMARSPAAPNDMSVTAGRAKLFHVSWRPNPQPSASETHVTLPQ